jgi:DMSO/TMAO reductase YedYZ molybdopterin-dependent catalytic subunit
MGIPAATRKERFTRGFIAGLLAGILASGIMLLLSLVTGGISLPEALGSAIAQKLPLTIFNYLHEHLGGDAKEYLFYIILIGQCLIFALCGGLCNLLIDRLRFNDIHVRDEQGDLPYRVGVGLAFVLWIFSGLVFLPLTGSGVFGSQLVTSTSTTMINLAVTGLAYGLIFILLHNWLAWRSLKQITKNGTQTAAILETKRGERRSFIRGGLIVIGLGTLGIAAWRFVVGPGGSSTADPALQSSLLQKYRQKISPPPKPNYETGTFPEIQGLSPEVTANANYYKVSKNFLSDPTVNGATWNLTVDGLVSHPYSVNYKDLAAFPTQTQYESMMCISNEVGGEYMSSAKWEGIRLKDILQRAGTINPGSTKVVLYAADNYSDSIHLSKALEDTTLMALHMNGVPLPSEHGYPARLLVPGIYGMKHVKWITHIQVVNTDFQGYWQQNGWSDPAPIKMTSRIDTPTDGTQVSADKPTYIAGVAFSGNLGISQVEVSTDGGENWQIATLKRPLSALTWVLWELPWQPKAGHQEIVVHAVDLQGNVQDPSIAQPIPDGSSGYHTITVTAI